VSEVGNLSQRMNRRWSPNRCLDAIVVEDSQGDGSLANSAGTNESDRSELFCEAHDFLDQLVASKEGPRWLWWGFSGCAKSKCQILEAIVSWDH
jgi:hypothetical protein